MAQMKLVYTTSTKLNQIAITDGQIIFLSDENQICLDMKGKRLIYKAIKTFDTDVQRLNSTPIEKTFYFVFETNVMWQYINSQWHQITASDLTPILFYPKEENFPAIGKENRLYYTNEGIYNWKNSDQEYNLIANANRWESI